MLRLIVAESPRNIEIESQICLHIMQEHPIIKTGKFILHRLVNILLNSISGPLASVVMATFSCRVCMFTGGVIASLSCVLSAYVDNIDMLILTYGVFGGIRL